MTLEDSAAEMQLRYLDYLDNTGSNEADWFWLMVRTRGTGLITGELEQLGSR